VDENTVPAYIKTQSLLMKLIVGPVLHWTECRIKPLSAAVGRDPAFARLRAHPGECDAVTMLVLNIEFFHVVVIEHLADEEQFQKSDILSTL
jgi:hypothetical protein